MLEGQQRVGVLAEAPKLLQELGADPAEVAASVGIDIHVLDDPENMIPFTAAGSSLRRLRRERDARTSGFWSANVATPEASASSVD